MVMLGENKWWAIKKNLWDISRVAGELWGYDKHGGGGWRNHIDGYWSNHLDGVWIYYIILLRIR